MAEIVTFGEIMLRLTAPGRMRLAQAPALEVHFGGAEANVAVMLAQLGESVDFVTKLPENELADRAIRELRGLQVGVEKIVRGGARMGVYFLEQGASQRPGRVIYDRAHSALAEAQPEEFDWARVLSGARWLHWSGITPALSAAAAAMVSEACQEARRRGLTVSFDLNYRSLLWSREEARRALVPLLEYVDLCVTSAEEVRSVLGVAGNAGAEDAETARAVQERFGCRWVALTQRTGERAGVTGWSALLLAEGRAWESRRYEIDIEDRVGAGDSFTGALIFALRRGDPSGAAIEFAAAASALKHTIHGDYNLTSVAEIEALAAGGHGSRVRR